MKTSLKQKVVVAGILPFFMLIATSCGIQSSDSETVSGETDVVALEAGTGGQLISIQSDNVSAAGYDAPSMVMTVQFDNGAVYEYYGVSSDLWASFLSAQPHPWSQIGYPRLVQGGIPYKRVG